MEGEIRRSKTAWTVVRPPKLVNKPLTGRYRTVVGGNVPRGYSISRADTAHAMAHCGLSGGDPDYPTLRGSLGRPSWVRGAMIAVETRGAVG
jgi:hypothetical protein